LFQCSSFATGAAPVSHKADRVDVQQQRGGAALIRGFRVEDMRPAEAQFRRMHPPGMLSQQVPQVGGRLEGGCDRQQHRMVVIERGLSVRS
jgi:hypothetical protein